MRRCQVVGWTYSMYGMVQLHDVIDIVVERMGRKGIHVALEVTCRIGSEVVSPHTARRHAESPRPRPGFRLWGLVHGAEVALADGDSYTRDAEGNYWYVTPYGKRYLCTVD